MDASTTRSRSAQTAALMERLQTAVNPRANDRRPDDRTAATGRDRQGGGAQRPHPHHGRADLGAQRARGRDPVPRHRRPQVEGRRDRLHLPPARGTDPHRRLHHRAARRPGHRGALDGGCRRPLDRATDDRLGRQGLLQGRASTLSGARRSGRKRSVCRASPAATPSTTSRCRFAPARSSESTV